MDTFGGGGTSSVACAAAASPSPLLAITLASNVTVGPCLLVEGAKAGVDPCFVLTGVAAAVTVRLANGLSWPGTVKPADFDFGVLGAVLAGVLAADATAIV